jgi:hypothetical protein
MTPCNPATALRMTSFMQSTTWRAIGSTFESILDLAFTHKRQAWSERA